MSMTHIIITAQQTAKKAPKQPPSCLYYTNLLSTYLPLETNTSGLGSGNSKFVPLIPSNAHLGKKTRAPSNPVATSAKEPDVSHSPKLNESSTGGENTQSSVESDPSNGQSTAFSDSAQQHIDLKACTDVKYEKRGDVHGVIASAAT